MTADTPQGESRSKDLLGNARRHYADITEALESALGQLATSDDKALRAFSTTAQTHWKSLLSLHEREVELEKRDLERAGIVEGYAIDLARARSEVGRRIACLRAAGNVEDVSGEPE